MTQQEPRQVPLLGEVSLEYVQRIEHRSDSGFTSLAIAGLPGEVQQRLARRSHRIRIEGTLFGEEAAAQLESLQGAAASGDELPFAADITTALDLSQVVVTRLWVVEDASQPHCYRYQLEIVESPPLPPPAELEPFGGLGGFGVGDLGFDTDILGDVTDLAQQVAGAVDDALGVIDALSALTNLGDLNFDGLLEPVGDLTSNIRSAGNLFRSAGDGLVGSLTAEDGE